MILLLVVIIMLLYTFIGITVHEFLLVFENGYHTKEQKETIAAFWPIFIPKMIIRKILQKVKERLG